MYSTCIYCHRSLGANQTIENFPIGRRLAFDATRGRLWAVCRVCRRWNLSPLEERWEAIEECERLFRATHLRFSTENIGLARIAEGVDLVRVGSPLRPEIAAWRYSSEFQRRRRKGIAFKAATTMIALTGPLAPLMVVPIWLERYRLRQKIVARIREGSFMNILREKHALRARILPAAPNISGSTWSLFVEHDEGFFHLYNAEAARIAGIALVRLNQRGGSRRDVKYAVSMLDATGDSHGMFGRIAKDVSSVPDLYAQELEQFASSAATLSSLPGPERLALEMAAHEETERVALEGHLHLLEQAWRDAEEIAYIADSLLLPPHVEEWVREKGARRL